MKTSWKLCIAAAAGLAAAGVVSRLNAVTTGPTFVVVPGSGFIVLNDVLVGPGHRVVSKFNGKRAGKCIDGSAADDYCRQYLDNNADGGKAYISYDSASHWTLSTSLVGTTTELDGNVDPTGAFMMSGTHTLSGAHVFLVGKVKFAKGTTNPTALSGTAYFTSTTIQEFGQLKFKSAGTLN